MRTAKDWLCWRNPTHEVAPTRFGWPQCGEPGCGAAPEYHERAAYLPDGFTLTIFVPTDKRATAILAERSAIVGQVVNDEWTSVYYEGWINGPMQYGDRDVRGLWEAGLLHAADRMVTNYPTIACAHLPAGMVVAVGTYNPKTREVVVTDEATLATWLGVEDATATDLRTKRFVERETWGRYLSDEEFERQFAERYKEKS